MLLKKKISADEIEFFKECFGELSDLIFLLMTLAKQNIQKKY